MLNEGTPQASNQVEIVLPVQGSKVNTVNETKAVETPKPVETPITQTTPIETPKPTETVADTTNTVVEQISIDDVLYTLDAKGNAIDTEGKVVLSNAEIAKLSTPAPSIIEEVEKLNNIILTDNSGQKIVYESTPKGVAAREKDILTYGETIGKQKAIDEFFEQHQDLKGIYQYKQQYGTTEGYGVKADYTNTSFDPKNKEQMKQFVIESELSTGKTKENAKRYADFVEANNELETVATEAFNSLKGKQEREIQEQQTKQAELINNYYGVAVDDKGELKDLNIENSIYDVILKKGEINGMKIPKEGITIKTNDGKVTKLTPNQLFEFASMAVDERGNSQLDVTIGNYMSKPANKIALGLYILKGGDLSDLAKKEVAKAEILKIRTQQAANSSNSNAVRNITTGKGGERVVTPLK